MLCVWLQLSTLGGKSVVVDPIVTAAPAAAGMANAATPTIEIAASMRA